MDPGVLVSIRKEILSSLRGPPVRRSRSITWPEAPLGQLHRDIFLQPSGITAGLAMPPRLSKPSRRRHRTETGKNSPPLRLSIEAVAQVLSGHTNIVVAAAQAQPLATYSHLRRP
ncbi:hypothetical protein [Bosea sp. FBZP-16]|uniref:hypothetical protein n=1 Tax=Bosea sp. FBZP-16 TaxID=2065382 RepID=UPI000C30ACBF|nr:hypothetical protein [Bosea sp. FBZP-16]